MDEISLWVLIGLPGSGKSTWAAHFARSGTPLQVVSTDQIRSHLYGNAAHQGEWRQIWQAVLHQFHQGVAATQGGAIGGVLYDATNVRRRGRRGLLQAAREQGFTRVAGIWLDVPVACCLQRNQQRSRRVPPEVIESMARQLAGAPPDCAEGFDALMHLTV